MVKPFLVQSGDPRKYPPKDFKPNLHYEKGHVEKSVTSWPSVGTQVWIAHHHHALDAHENNTYRPVKRTVLSVGTDTVHLKDSDDCQITDCYATREECKVFCLEAHADP